MKPLYVSAISDEDDCNEFVLTRTHMMPSHDGDFLRCISKEEVKAALKNPDKDMVVCSDVPNSNHKTAWKIRRNRGGSITVGCTKFPKKSVDKIKKWATGTSRQNTRKAGGQ